MADDVYGPLPLQSVLGGKGHEPLQAPKKLEHILDVPDLVRTVHAPDHRGAAVPDETLPYYGEEGTRPKHVILFGYHFFKPVPVLLHVLLFTMQLLLLLLGQVPQFLTSAGLRVHFALLSRPGKEGLIPHAAAVLRLPSQQLILVALQTGLFNLQFLLQFISQLLHFRRLPDLVIQDLDLLGLILLNLDFLLLLLVIIHITTLTHSASTLPHSASTLPHSTSTLAHPTSTLAHALP